jgi:hypothetical protein
MSLSRKIASTRETPLPTMPGERQARAGQLPSTSRSTKPSGKTGK